MPDGSDLIEGSLSGKKDEAEKIARKLAFLFYNQGASKIVEYIRGISDE